MANKAMWDFMDKAEGRTDSSYSNMKQERKRQGYDKSSSKKMSMAKKMSTNGMKASTDGKPSKGVNN
jgi:hypothetical protein